METKYKQIEFDIELAKKIQAGEVPGKIVTRGGEEVRIVCFDYHGEGGECILAIDRIEKQGKIIESVIESFADGNYTGDPDDESEYDLLIQVPIWIEYKEGDILACEVHNGPNDYCKWYAVLEDKIGYALGRPYFFSHVSYDYDSSRKTNKVIYGEICDNIGSIRLATEEEKQKFADVLRSENNDTANKLLKKYFGDASPQLEFKPFDKVLWRDEDEDVWQCGLFSHYTESVEYPYALNYGWCAQCIPFNEETEHLRGTKEGWKK